MKNLPRIYAAYQRLDGLLQREIAAAVARSDQGEGSKLTDTKDMLEYAFFVLSFAQFEREVNTVFEAGYQSRVGNPDWTRRRGWDLDAYAEPTRVPFKDRVAMVIDREKPTYGTILADYAKRNHVAHRGLTEPLSPLDVFIKSFSSVNQN